MSGYELIGVDGVRVVRTKKAHPKAPSTDTMVRWGLRRKVRFVLRYMPSKKGWRAVDIRGAHKNPPMQLQNGSVISTFVGHKVLPRIYPNEDAAVMHLMAVMDGTQGKLL